MYSLSRSRDMRKINVRMKCTVLKKKNIIIILKDQTKEMAYAEK
jgi:hypothetical protein